MGQATITLRQREQDGQRKTVVLERQLSVWHRLWNQTFLRKTAIIVVLAIAWQVYGSVVNNTLLFPTLSDTVSSFVSSIQSGVLVDRAWTSLRILVLGYVTGIVIAAALTILAISTRIGTDFLEVMTAMFNPLPAIALLPLALLWFGLGTTSIVFVLLHSVVWVVALNTQGGFLSVSQTLRMVGRNYELTGLRYVSLILIPAAFPAILTGLKIAWAFAWRTLIAAELVFGVSSGKGGLGWYIFENRNLLDIPAVFAGLLTVIVIGLIVENFVFRLVEKRTVRRWGMQS
ncbi:ABC transporter permease [Castellaniella sp. MT123]|uniref:ABC transporter permease n=1 Tax=Castellaniella sp. MT123 TaxID=3140381 RepID=UPI0031F407EA